MATLVLVVACTGCATRGSHFTVDTRSDDPLIYAPGTVPGKDFNLTLEGFHLGCRQRTLSITPGKVIELSQPRWAGSNAPARAHLSVKTALYIADRVRKGSFEDLVTALEKFQADKPACNLKGGDEGNLLVAEALMRQLPLHYSAVLRSSYNHRVWNKGNTTSGISLDLSAGMRLRLENSVAIPPAGINARNVHPSAFAAPTYLYFHTLSASELCGTDAIYASGHVCEKKPNAWESTFFLSPSGGLARLGLVQKNEDTSTTQLEASSLLDLLERHLGSGKGASTWWRLWLPAHRSTESSEGLEYGKGSPEAKEVPLLLSAESLKELQKINFADSNPCEDNSTLQGIICHSLHYRVMPIPEISIQVNGQREWVPVGTTLHDLLAERLHGGFVSRVPYLAANLSPAHDDLPAPTTREALYRAALEGVRIRRFDWRGYHDLQPYELADAAQLARFMRLQLLPGDDIKWN